MWEDYQILPATIATMKALIILAWLTGGLAFARVATAEITVFTCKFTGFNTMFITIYDEGSPSRIGVEVGVGSKAQAYSDPPTGATLVVEFNGVGLPITLTTINRDGKAVHSRHLLAIPEGWFLPSQTIGQCESRAIH
jgi:hypothetical protein